MVLLSFFFTVYLALVSHGVSFQTSRFRRAYELSHPIGPVMADRIPNPVVTSSTGLMMSLSSRTPWR